MGSFTIRDAQGRKAKAYICLFVCVTTRAVHLKVVDNLTTASFIMCLRRLAASKGMPSLILSDNHKTFLGGRPSCSTCSRTPPCKNISLQKRPVETSNSKVPLDGRKFRASSSNHQSKSSHRHLKKTTHTQGVYYRSERGGEYRQLPTSHLSIGRNKRHSFDTIAIGLGEGSHPHASTPAAQGPSRRRLRRQSDQSAICGTKQRPRALSEAMAY